MQYKRHWPIAETQTLLLERWQAFLQAPDREKAFKETRDRKCAGRYPPLFPGPKDPALDSLDDTAPAPTIVSIAFRSFDRQWGFADTRLGDFIKPVLHRSHSDSQLYLTSIFTKVLGRGPALVATALVPDMDHFCNRGAKDVAPLYREAGTDHPNLTHGLRDVLSTHFGERVSALDIAAYCYAILANPSYVDLFWAELTVPGMRVPITKESRLFKSAVVLGKELLWLHTFGERCRDKTAKRLALTPGNAKCLTAVPTGPGQYPNEYRYDLASQTLHVGGGSFGPVSPEVWGFSVSGYQVVHSWLSYRMADRAGKHSSALDDIRPTKWAPELTDELLRVLWVLEGTVALRSDADAVLKAIVDAEKFDESELPAPTNQERTKPSGDEEDDEDDETHFDFENEE